MIQKLTITSREEADEILSIQTLAYQVEAQLIGFDGIPQLGDTTSSIIGCGETFIGCGETFIGYKVEDKLTGFLSYTIENNTVDICRLVVHPNHFRKGIARKLMEYVIKENIMQEKFIVSTGEKNTPAIKLYERFGFQVYQKIEVAKGVYVVSMEKK